MSMTRTIAFSATVTAAMAISGGVFAQDLCQGFGPQTPRDIASATGSNARVWTAAPASTAMNLCNIHTHTNAEHKGPGFSVFAGYEEEHGGYQCNGTADLTEAELEEAGHGGHEGFHGIKPGDTIEVHWVYSSCDITPGEGLGSCLSDACVNPELRVETQVFLVVNDHNALNFNDFTYEGHMMDGLSQPKALPTGTGNPIEFLGSTTGPKYTEATCSPLQVTWSVRPDCAKLDVNSIYEWGENGNVFNENHSHDVRHLVTSPELLSQIN